MTLREKQRLRRLVVLNAQEYRRVRRDAALHVMRGTADEKTLSHLRWVLAHSALGVAEAVAALEQHEDDAA